MPKLEKRLKSTILESVVSKKRSPHTGTNTADTPVMGDDDRKNRWYTTHEMGGEVKREKKTIYDEK